MKTISCIIIDDEKANRQVLTNMLKRHCPELHVIAEADSALTAYELINERKPELIFLDIKMPGKSGFDLLEMFHHINFEVIFVTAYDEFAVSAFEFNALGYILKPIDYRKLIYTVEKAVKTIHTKTQASENIIYFVKSLNEKKELLNKILLHHNDKVILLEIKDIGYIEAKGEYSEINTMDGRHIYSSKPLRNYDELLHSQLNFIRISKSVLINLDFFKAYSKGIGCSITLKNDIEFQISRRKKSEIIEKLREFTSNIQ